MRYYEYMNEMHSDLTKWCACVCYGMRWLIKNKNNERRNKTRAIIT